ncbi:MAG TPA: YheC/YheD family protein [Bacillales bacterium]|nr:YheC/YheD family protein [Bacillales bacterium]
MKIYYDTLQHKWSHRQPGEYIWGKERRVLPRSPFSPALSFSVRKQGKRIGPLVGILTSPGRASFTGNRATFREIHRALQDRGGILFTFTPQTTVQNRIKGYVFNDEKRKWIKTDFPYPDVVYNRIPIRADEEKPPMQSFLKHLESLDIPFFNAGFLDKWEMYECLRGDPMLIPYLPDTRPSSKSEMQKVLYAWGELFLKPKAGQKGDNIEILKQLKDGSIICRGYNATEHFPNFQELWESRQADLEKISYLLQKKINLMRMNRRPYDFRILIQKVSGKWKWTGAGARLAGKNAVTTHVPKGGTLLSLDEVHPPADLYQLDTICIRAAEQLEKYFAPLCELSFDIGRDQNGHYWLFEANAKPMVFDEPDIEAKRMERLLDIFYEKSGFLGTSAI